MAGSKTAYMEQKLLQHALGNVAYSAPGTWYVALSTLSFDPTSTGTVMGEVSGGGYARIALTNNLTNFPAPTGTSPSTLANGVDIAFATATAGWGTVLSAYLVDAATLGNTGYGGDLASPVTVNTGPSLTIPAGQFVFQET